jgi:D-alanine-D-alanine ligase
MQRCKGTRAVPEAFAMTRLRVGVVYGGRSGEHEISLRSAATVIGALDPQRFDVVPIAITKDGRWLTGRDSRRLLEEAQRVLAPVVEHGQEVMLPPVPSRGALVPVSGGAGQLALDVVFPVLHGTFGEDGTIQGLLDMAGIPYVGAGVLASSVGMDKAVMKAMFRDAGLPGCHWIVARPASESLAEIRARVESELGFPCFVKPCNLGSSVGVAKVKTPGELGAAVADAAAYDPKVIIEEAIDARELECGVLGNEQAEASVVGELLPSHEFYDYADKYVDDKVRWVIPAELPAAITESVRTLAVRAFHAIDCSGSARVDFFLERGSDRLLLNEINTMPGFTSASMYPLMWQASGVPLPALVEKLVTLARERHATRANRRFSFTPPEVLSAPPRSSRGGS